MRHNARKKARKKRTGEKKKKCEHKVTVEALGVTERGGSRGGHSIKEMGWWLYANEGPWTMVRICALALHTKACIKLCFRFCRNKKKKKMEKGWPCHFLPCCSSPPHVHLPAPFLFFYLAWMPLSMPIQRKRPCMHEPLGAKKKTIVGSFFFFGLSYYRFGGGWSS